MGLRGAPGPSRPDGEEGLRPRRRPAQLTVKRGDSPRSPRRTASRSRRSERQPRAVSNPNVLRSARPSGRPGRRRSGRVDPLVGAVGEPLVLPHRQRALDLVDQLGAGRERPAGGRRRRRRPARPRRCPGRPPGGSRPSRARRERGRRPRRRLGATTAAVGWALYSSPAYGAAAVVVAHHAGEGDHGAGRRVAPPARRARRRRAARRRRRRGSTAAPRLHVIGGRLLAAGRRRGRARRPSTASPSRTPPVDPGRFTTRVRPATPARPRESTAVGTSARPRRGSRRRARAPRSRAARG